MKTKVYSIKGTVKSEVSLPEQFGEEVRIEVIRRAFYSELSNSIQQQSTSVTAGHKTSSKLSKRRRAYRGSYGRGKNRTPRKVMSRRGTQFNYVGAFAPFTRGGRVAHPPKAEKIIVEKINTKERRLAIRSCLSASSNKYFVENKHRVKGLTYPIVLSDDFEKMKKTKDVFEVLQKIGLTEELNRSKVRKIRAGKGKMRNRRYRTRKGPLFILPAGSKLSKFVRNIRGVNINSEDKLSLKELCPGGQPGRLLVFTDSSLENLGKGGLYL